MGLEITERLASGQYARLIPTVADSKKEERATSSLLASFMVVPGFAREVLSDAGAPVGKRIKIVCYTEVTFKNNEKSKGPRPDGLIIITSGSKQWTALIESKIGNAELTKEQVEEYLDLAKAHGINALITISNQFSTTPTHHPIKVSKNKLRSVELYHFSWLSLKSRAVLLTANKNVEDPEQAYILSELVRYLDHDSSGVSSLTRMPGEWKNLCSSVQHGTALSKTSEIVEISVSGWHQLLRHLSLNLSMSIGQPVKIALSRAREKEAELNFSGDCADLAQNNGFSTEFEIPNAASRIIFSADCLRRTINISMKLEAPKDRARATASINWITRQLRSKGIGNVGLRAYWPRRIPMTSASLVEATEDPTVLIPEGVSDLPTYLEVVRIVDMAARFKGAKTFVEDSSKEFPLFYQDIGQHLSRWVAKAPKVKESEAVNSSIPNILSNSDDELRIDAPIPEGKTPESSTNTNESTTEHI
ncbi:MAG: hypothetical protein L3J98_13720 [Gammaproteobacteria bacterium]|nr:hypothetical protein [Gammaproteobacteria bacterium]MCF6261198.1 hypothetical protein [Gammaproteobacteria bacterium]